MDVHEIKYRIGRVKAGDRDAFSGLVDAYKDMVYTVCLRMLTSEADAEEAAQDVFVKVYRSLESFQEKAKFSTWLYRIAYNHCISVIRKKVKMIDLVDEIPDGEVDEGEMNGLESISVEERSRYLKMAIESLAETDAVVVTLFYYDEMSLDEIAEITGLTSGNIRIKLHRSRKKMYRVICENLKSEVSSIL
ncbi:MAG: sigma-70 family RNA polymerase sigma factor [Bacteroidales bacterium]|nr:sigma-70 family RNA polymerase sigma factor [Bacteroidales bacterium]